MAKISAHASIGAKLKFPKWNKAFDDFENINPVASIGIEREVSDDLSDDELLEEANKLYVKCRKHVEAEINSDIRSSKTSEKPKKED